MAAAPYVIDEYVRWSDVDFAGIICYGAYLRFFELAETELFRAAGAPYGELFDRFDFWLPRVEIHSEFHYPARLDDRLRVGAHVARVGHTSLTIGFHVLHVPTRKLNADGHQVVVSVDRQTLRPKLLPPEFVTLLAPFTLAPEDALAEIGGSLGAL